MSKQLRSWRPYEAAYVKAMALCGVGKSECVERLWEVNSTLGAPYRGEVTVGRMGGCVFDRVRRKRRVDAAADRYKKIANHLSATGENYIETALHFKCATSTVYAARRYMKLKMKYDNNERENGWHSEEDECLKNLAQAGYSFVQIEKSLKALNAENGRPYRSYNAIRMRASRKLHVRRFKKDG